MCIKPLSRDDQVVGLEISTLLKQRASNSWLFLCKLLDKNV